MSDHLKLTARDAAQAALFALSRLSPDDVVIDGYLGDLYRPRPALKKHLKRLKAYDPDNATKAEREDAGRLLEQIAFLAFRGLTTPTTIKSFCAAGAQYDLLVSGDTLQWQYVQWLARMPVNRRTILVECKATKTPVDDAQFSRVCSLIEHELGGAPGLGVFFTLNGASGFPTSNKKREGVLSQARMVQALFHAKASVPVVVFDRSEILTLDQPGSLLRLLGRKSLDAALQSGLKTTPVSVAIDEDLPEHLRGIDTP